MAASADNPDSCIPTPLKDFVFDLHDSVRVSQIPSEQQALYSGSFRELTAKYFDKSPWPSPQSISDECQGDPLFLALYKEITERHLHSITKVSAIVRVKGWHVYRDLFDLLLEEASKEQPKREQENDNDDNNNNEEKIDHSADALYLLPEWTFDILHEFVYQFQGFCQFRTAAFANAAKYGPGGPSHGKPVPHNITEMIQVLTTNKDAWAVETVLFYLHRLVSIGRESTIPAFQYFGLFASVTLSRLECLLGDYSASLNALSSISGKIGKHTLIDPPRGEEDGRIMSVEEIVHSVFAARLSMSYHAGVSYIMLRRYRDATTVLSEICSAMQRAFKSGQFKKLGSAADQFKKLYDRMIALLAILTHVCPASLNIIDDAISKVVRDVHGNQLSKIEAGEEGYEDLFTFACPKFVTPAVPEYDLALTVGASVGPSQQDAYKLQVKHFMNEMASQRTMRKLRSYMKLYTSIPVDKLGRLVMEEDILSLLLSYKHKMRQIQNDTAAASDDDDATTTAKSELKVSSVSDIHFYITDDLIHIDGAERLHRFENYFMSQISQSLDIINHVQKLNVNY